MPITPQSCIHENNNVPDDMVQRVNAARKLYDDACRFGIIDSSNTICEPDAQMSDALKGLTAQCENLLPTLNNPTQQQAAVKLLTNIKNAMNVRMIPTRFSINVDGDQNQAENIRKDYFVSSPAIHPSVERDLEVLRKADAVIVKMEEKLNQLKSSGSQLEDFTYAVLTGAISYNNVTLTCEDAFGNVIVLSDFDDAFEFRSIPIYQAYVTYSNQPDSVKSLLKDIYKERVRSKSDDAIANVAKLETIITKSKIDGWNKLADGFAQKNEIKTFIRTFVDELTKQSTNISQFNIK